MFGLIMALPMILHAGAALMPSGQDLAAENRNLAALPPARLLLSEPRNYTAQVSEYLEDHFGGRRPMIRTANQLKLKINGRTTRVLSGTEYPWLFLSSPETTTLFTGINARALKDIKAWNQEHDNLRQFFQDQNIQFVSAAIPVKSRIYPEYVPRAMGVFAPENLSDLAFDIDPEDALRAAKSDGPVFHKTDTHWTRFGAKIAYGAIMTEIAPGWQNSIRSELAVRDESFAGDLVALSGVSDDDHNEVSTDITFPRFPGVKRSILEKDNPVFNTVAFEKPDGDRTLVIIGDSFSGAIAPFFLSDFDRVIRIHHQFGNFDPDEVLSFDPDIILLAPAGRYRFKSLEARL